MPKCSFTNAQIHQMSLPGVTALVIPVRGRYLEKVMNHIPIQTSPWGNPGDIVEVQESFIDLFGTGVEHRPAPNLKPVRYIYRKDHPKGSVGDEIMREEGLKWEPASKMPRDAVRTWLRVNSVRVATYSTTTLEEMKQITFRREYLINDLIRSAFLNHCNSVDLRIRTQGLPFWILAYDRLTSKPEGM